MKPVSIGLGEAEYSLCDDDTSNTILGLLGSEVNRVCVGPGDRGDEDPTPVERASSPGVRGGGPRLVDARIPPGDGIDPNEPNG